MWRMACYNSIQNIIKRGFSIRSREMVKLMAVKNLFVMKEKIFIIALKCKQTVEISTDFCSFFYKRRETRAT